MKQIYYDDATGKLYWAEGCLHGAINFNDTWRPVKVNGAEVLSSQLGTLLNPSALNLIPGNNITITSSLSTPGDITIGATGVVTSVGSVSFTASQSTTPTTTSFLNNLTLANVAWTGSFSDLSNTPAICSSVYVDSSVTDPPYTLYVRSEAQTNRLYVTYPTIPVLGAGASEHLISGSYRVLGSGYTGTATKFLKEDGSWDSPSIANTWRNISIKPAGQLTATQILDTTTGTGLTLQAGANILLSGDATGAVTIGAEIPAASNNTLGGIKTGYTPIPTALTEFPVKVDPTYSKAFVDIPYATTSTPGIVTLGYTTNGRNYAVLENNRQLYVNVPWINTTYFGDETSYTTAITNNEIVALGYKRSDYRTLSTIAYKFILKDENIYYPSGYTQKTYTGKIELAPYTHDTAGEDMAFNRINISSASTAVTQMIQLNTSHPITWVGSKIVRYLLTTSTSSAVTLDYSQIVTSGSSLVVLHDFGTSVTHTIELNPTEGLYLEFIYWPNNALSNLYMITVSHKTMTL